MFLNVKLYSAREANPNDPTKETGYIERLLREFQEFCRVLVGELKLAFLVKEFS